VGFRSKCCEDGETTFSSSCDDVPPKKIYNNNTSLAVTQLFSTYHLSRDTTPLFSLDSTLKGTVPRDFLILVFFFKQLLLASVDKPSNDFNFFQIFAEIFDYFGASPVSTTLAMHALLVSLTPVINSSPVLTTPVSDTYFFRELHRCQRHWQKIPHRCH
jgi:hypothetical protein